MKLNSIFVILVEPVYKGNVGAVARVMNNFGFENLRIVGKIPEKEDHYLAVHSEDLLNNASIYESLEHAIHDLDRVIAFSRRSGKKKEIDLLPEEMATYIKSTNDLRVGLVFGRETYGLTDDEANLCHLRCFIPTAPHFPSLNLAQSVAIALYELFVKKHERNKAKKASAEKIQDTLQYIELVLQSIGFYNKQREPLHDLWEHLLFSANISERMGYQLQQAFNRIHVIVKGKGIGFQISKTKDTQNEDTKS